MQLTDVDNLTENNEKKDLLLLLLFRLFPFVN